MVQDHSWAPTIRDIQESNSIYHSDDVLRSVITAVDVMRLLGNRDPAALRIALATEPANTGSPEWDAVIAGVTEMLCLEYDISCPEWIYGPDRYLDRAWSYTDNDRLFPLIFVETPRSLALRGVFMSRTTFESV